MKNLFLLAILAFGISFVTSCKKDNEEPQAIDYEYHAHIDAPTSADRNLNDTMHMEVNFESHAGETVHHINVRVYNKADQTEVFNGPAEAHVHSTGSSYEFHEHLTLSTANGFSANSDWILEAKVWGEAEGEGEVVESVEFHIN